MPAGFHNRIVSVAPAGRKILPHPGVGTLFIFHLSSVSNPASLSISLSLALFLSGCVGLSVRGHLGVVCHAVVLADLSAFHSLPSCFCRTFSLSGKISSPLLLLFCFSLPSNSPSASRPRSGSCASLLPSSPFFSLLLPLFPLSLSSLSTFLSHLLALFRFAPASCRLFAGPELPLRRSKFSLFSFSSFCRTCCGRSDDTHQSRNPACLLLRPLWRMLTGITRSAARSRPGSAGRRTRRDPTFSP